MEATAARRATAGLTPGAARPKIVGLLPRGSIPIRAIGRILRAIGREIAAALRLAADVESQVSPQDVARRHTRGELGKDAPEAEPDDRRRY